MQVIRRKAVRAKPGRRGSATLDYVLLLGATAPLAGLAYYKSAQIIKSVYEMTCVLVSWPFM